MLPSGAPVGVAQAGGSITLTMPADTTTAPDRVIVLTTARP